MLTIGHAQSSYLIPRADHDISLVQGFFVSMGGYMVYKYRGRRPAASHEVGGRLLPVRGLENAISTAAISDRSKGDEWTKGIAVLQTAWFLAQCVARQVQGLAITELEIATTAFALVNIVIYIVWWSKPQDVRCPVETEYVMRTLEELYAEREADTLSLERRNGQGQPNGQGMGHAFSAKILVLLLTFSGEDEDADLPSAYQRVPTLWAGRLGERQRGIAAGISVMVAAGFGATHFALWNTAFPSRTEQILWRVAAISVTVVPVIFFLDAIYLYGRNPTEFYVDLTYYFVVPLGVTIYIIARALLMVLPFLSLRSLPPDAYKDVDWTAYIPHFS